ncbi:amidase [Tianweitania populi]|uniref:Amidase n=1 Tax=Tianweitania populi TaxID=1607949 RepID=A0A8J3DYX1_9HYPH|nr:amidase [Tianweitania populi]GHD20712.1 amidase [Tianweitania populi]
MSNAALLNLTAVEAVERLKSRDISSLELVEASIRRIEAVEPKVNALPITCFERARTQARHFDDAKGSASILTGLPISVKDLDEVAGVRHTNGGSVIFEEYVATKSSPMVETLETNGAITMGKSNSPEFGFNANTINDLFGPTRNPYDTSRTAAGSSGGAAVSVATGEVWLATGSDLGSSIRLPAAYNSVVGLRPSPGRVPRARKGMPFNTLAVLGPIARTVGDTALMLDAMVAEHWADPLTIPVTEGQFLHAASNRKAPRRIGFSPDLGVTPVDPEIAAIVEAAAKRFTEAGIPVEHDAPDLSNGVEVFHAIRGVNHLANMGPLCEAHGDRMIPEIHYSVKRAAELPITRYAWGERERAQMFLRTMAFFDDYDLLVCPTGIMEPFPCDWRRVDKLHDHEFDAYIDWIAITYTISLLGCPSISVPCGFTKSGMPVGLQLVGRPRGEADLLAAAQIFEDIVGALGRTPVDPRAPRGPYAGSAQCRTPANG